MFAKSLRHLWPPRLQELEQVFKKHKTAEQRWWVMSSLTSLLVVGLVIGVIGAVTPKSEWLVPLLVVLVLSFGLAVFGLVQFQKSQKLVAAVTAEFKRAVTELTDQIRWLVLAVKVAEAAGGDYYLFAFFRPNRLVQLFQISAELPDKEIIQRLQLRARELGVSGLSPLGTRVGIVPNVSDAWKWLLATAKRAGFGDFTGYSFPRVNIHYL
jgi:hypothetical protein